MSVKENYLKNIKTNYIFSFFNNLDLTRALWVLYIASKGLTLVEIGMIESIFHITSFTMEIPTGMVADIFGRKTSRVLGKVFNLVSSILVLLSNSFWGFALAFSVAAISYNLESGAGEALIYDSLKESHKEDEFIKVSGRLELIFNIASIISFLLGGYVAKISYELAYAISIIFSALALVTSLNLKEVPVIKDVESEIKNPFSIFKNQLRDSIKSFTSNKKIGTIMIISEILGATSTTMFFYLQIHWKNNSYSEFQMGIIFSISCVICGILGVFISKIEEKLKEKGILLFLPMVFLINLFGIAFTKYSPVFYILISVIENIIFVSTSKYINLMIPSAQRATILSFRSMIFSFFMIFIFPLVGKLGDIISLQHTFKVIFFIVAILVALNSILIINSQRKEEISEGIS